LHNQPVRQLPRHWPFDHHQPETSDAYDEDGDRFPNLDAAVHTHAVKLVRLTEYPTGWIAMPMRHET
jgi:hypothetical protein